MTQLGKSMCKSIEMLSRVICNNAIHPYSQNSFHQNVPQQQHQMYPQGPYAQWNYGNEQEEMKIVNRTVAADIKICNLVIKVQILL